MCGSIQAGREGPHDALVVSLTVVAGVQRSTLRPADATLGYNYQGSTNVDRHRLDVACSEASSRELQTNGGIGTEAFKTYYLAIAHELGK